MDPATFALRIRKLIRNSSHFLVIFSAQSITSGIEAEYARSLGLPIAVWNLSPIANSRILSTIASDERRENETIESLLVRFLV